MQELQKKFDKVKTIVKEKLQPLGESGLFKSAKLYERMDENQQALEMLYKLHDMQPGKISYINE